jgi:hypothetical protein
MSLQLINPANEVKLYALFEEGEFYGVFSSLYAVADKILSWIETEKTIEEVVLELEKRGCFGVGNYYIETTILDDKGGN